ncbi:uncharacterized protein LOC144877905 [Branchiostoma floridae x Branchiostoma japonicum]
MMKLLVFLCAVALASARRFHIPISERGARFQETVEVGGGYRLAEVPAHNNRDHIRVLSSRRVGETMYCMPERGVCFLMATAQRGGEGQDGALETELTQLERTGLVAETDTVTVQNDWVVLEQNMDRSALSDPRMRRFHQDLPLHRVDKLTGGADFLTESSDADAAPASKRQLISGSCRNDAAPQRKYAATSPTGCGYGYEYLVYCAGQNSQYSDCPRYHVTDYFFMTCLCCPEHTAKEQCLYCTQLSCSGYYDNTGVC